MKRKRDRQGRYREQAFRAIEVEDYELADRRFRVADDTLGIALAAYYGGSGERAIGKSLVALSTSEEGSVEESIALKILDMATKELGAEKIHGPARQRREALVARARARLEGVDWRRVHVHTSKLAREQPGIYGKLASESMGLKLMGEWLHKSVELALMGDFHRAAALRHETGRVTTTMAMFLTEYSLCPDCLRDWMEMPQNKAIEEMMRSITEDALPKLLVLDPRGPEEALVFAVATLNLAEYLGNRGKDVEKLLERAGAFCVAAVLPASASPEDTERWTAFMDFHRGRIKEAAREEAGALAILDKIASCTVVPWNERAREAAGRIRRRQALETKGQRMAELRKECEDARQKGDGPAEIAALAALSSEEELELAALERLASLRAMAGDAGWIATAREAALRGSRDESIAMRLSGEGGREWASGRAREALGLFRLARRVGPLPADSMSAYADVLASIGRPEEAAVAYEALGQQDPRRFLDAARCYLEAGEGELAVAAVQTLFTHRTVVDSWREGLKLVELSAPAGVLRELARRVVRIHPDDAAARATLARAEEAEYRAASEGRERRRAEARELLKSGAWREARSLLSDIREDLRDGEIWISLAKANEALGDADEAVRCYERLPLSPVSLAGRARSLARSRRYEESGRVLEELDARLDSEENPGLGDDPNLRGLWAEARGNLREAARLVEDEGLLGSLLGRARSRGDVNAELEALKNLATRHTTYADELMARVRGLEGQMPVRTKAQFIRGRMPTLVLCDTNVLLSRVVHGMSMPEGLRGMGRPQTAERFDRLKSGKEGARLAVTDTVERELRALLMYRLAVTEDGEASAAIEEIIDRAGKLVSEIRIERVAKRSPRPSSEDLEGVSSFYLSLAPRLRKIARQKTSRQPERAAAIMRKRGVDRKRPARDPMPEHVDQRLLAEAVSLVSGPLPGFGGVGILSDDADFRSFEREIETTFGVIIC